MEEHCSWGYCYQEEENEELKYSFLYTLELESTVVSAREEIAKREFELVCLKDVLNRTLKERDEAQTKCQKLTLENHLLLQHQQLLLLQQEAACTEDESKPADDDPRKHFSVSSIAADSDSKEITKPQPQPQPRPLLHPEATVSHPEEANEKPLPEKGKLLKAVMEAGPLLQTLLLAGPLPQWQHPPPKLDSIEIPPVSISSSSPRLSNQASFTSSISSCFSNKRGLAQLNELDSDSSPHSKYQKLQAFH